jgi:DNA-binding SARP family transcriptional activator
MNRIEVRLLGPMQVRRGDGSVVEPGEWRTVKTLDLLRLLALSGGEPVPVTTVIDKLWPDVDEARGRASLRTAASHLRKVVAADCVERRGGALVLRDVWVDTQAYEALLSDAEAGRRSAQPARTVAVVQEAEALYVGDLEVSDSSGDWLHEAREHLRRLRCRALLDAAEASASLCWMRDSLLFARRAADLDMCEEAARALMRAHAGLGEIEKALEIFDQTRRRLADGYGVDPSPQTRALHLQLLTGTAAVEEKDVALVGHEQALDALTESVLRMHGADRGAGIVWLVGEPGCGRDSIAEAACRQAGLSMHDMGRDPWLRGSVGVPAASWELPDADVVLMPSAESVPRHALKVLETLAGRQRGVLVVPVRRAPDATVRDGSLDVPQEVVEAGPLTVGELSELAEVVLQGMPGPRLLRQLRAASHGLSGTACRTARSWLTEGRVVWSIDGLELAAAPTPQGAAASAVLRRRLRMLSPGAEDLVNVLAVVGGDVGRRQLAEVVTSLREDGVDPDVETALGQLLDSGLVVLGAAGYRLREDHARLELLAWMRPSLRHRIESLCADQVAIPKPRCADEPIAVGEAPRNAVTLTSQSSRPRTSLLRHARATARRSHDRLYGFAGLVAVTPELDAVSRLLAVG